MPDNAAERIAGLDWDSIRQSLDEHGYAKLPSMLDSTQCEELIGGYGEERLYRSTINMARYRFGLGEYKYYRAPLPDVIREMREAFYPPLADIANSWLKRLNQETLYPDSLSGFLEQCRREEQTRPTPLILKYEAGGYNCLHQDVYGSVFFPFQVVFALNRKEQDYTGGEFLLVEQRPRAQSRGHVLTLERGEGLIFPTTHRPVSGSRGYYKTTLRHGVSTVTTGTRYSLGLVFHDAK
ncbi:2OG-Fe(II) oxygenase [Paenibacillus chitinolyticus]|uniref:2OG-Fe(II) oxygenase n=1 Tax=Paenibacillus chitinolyticus TaxID=79263 RepID=UPI002DBF38C7|nr:2OG-Fe(II) oxygenase [Paenibacillus chitinolyticus]MEC0245566.1 2OG-Fe(II) oxygenase [Paenibacillus chitinolyticus]